MPDDVDAPDEGEEKQEATPAPVEVRFRTSAGDGRQAFAAPVKLSRALPPPARLSKPFFGHALYRPGDKARIVVTAGGVQRAMLKLVVEKQAGGAWEKLADLIAPIQHGSASATWIAAEVEAGAPIKVRVRAIAPFGEEASDPVTVERAGELKDPAFSHAHPKRGAHFDHGDEAVLRVTAKGLDGRKVKFVVEQQQDGKWSPYETVMATVAGGQAIARLAVRHPALLKTPKLAELQAAKPVQLRFHAELA